MKRKNETVGIVEADAYLRYSSSLQDEGNSIEYQRAEILKYCETHGLVVRNWYIDKATSARSVVGREQFLRLLSSIEEGTSAPVMIVWRTNRAFRNVSESIMYREMMKAAGVRFVSVTQNIDEDTSAGRFQTNVFASFDQYKSEEIAEHVAAAQREMVQGGFHIGGTPPFGYKLVDVDFNGKPRRKLVPCPEKAPVLVSIFEEVAKGGTIRGVCRRLRDEGHRALRGGHISRNTLLDMLKNEIYLGVRYIKSNHGGDYRVEGYCEPLISRGLFDEVQRVMEENKKKKGQSRKRQNSYVLSGSLECGCCGRAIVGHTTANYLYYKCPARGALYDCPTLSTRKEALEGLVFQAVLENVLSEPAIEQILAEVKAELRRSAARDVDKAELVRSRDKLQEEIAELVQMRLDKIISTETLVSMKAPKEAELAQIVGELAEVELLEENILDAETIRKSVRSIFDVSSGSDASLIDSEVLRQIFNDVVEKVVVTNDSAEVFLRVPLNLSVLFNGRNAPRLRCLYKKIEIKKRSS